eukprot:CAMPEP_0178376878 /NCGR_PEP_ID=MMETSP0689_2-20121128/3630_1 /TAXON_ID=160604 /ORGANISM="Amphidinium massartii, Strain CS-259" /LENGTH=795 /DNA_ID=CAMNT_0019996915 /DNA_START=27 /DNA_END=2411 /DNA_ORIENTATION=+
MDDSGGVAVSQQLLQQHHLRLKQYMEKRFHKLELSLQEIYALQNKSLSAGVARSHSGIERSQGQGQFISFGQLNRSVPVRAPSPLGGHYIGQSSLVEEDYVSANGVLRELQDTEETFLHVTGESVEANGHDAAGHSLDGEHFEEAVAYEVDGCASFKGSLAKAQGDDQTDCENQDKFDGAFARNAQQSEFSRAMASASPDAPVHTVKVRKEWDAPPAFFEAGVMTTVRSFGRQSSVTWNNLNRGTSNERVILGGSCFWRNLLYGTVISANSPFQVCWEMMSVLVVVFDMFEIPLQVFSPPDSLFLDAMRWIAQLFWTIDISLSFRFGYFEGDEEVRSPGRIAKRYLRTWFLFDFMIVSIGWFFFMLENSSSGADSYVFLAKAGKTLKVCRAARTVRMVRLLKMRKALYTFEDHLLNTMLGSQTPLWGAAKFLLAVVLLCHFLCCLWFWAGKNAGEEGWIHRYSVTQLPFAERYLLTFHWSLSQFGVGNNEIVGQTIGEYLCNIAILLAGLLITALLVSSITNTFSVLQQQTADQFHQMWLLRRFCLEKEFPRWLSSRVALYVERQINKKTANMDLADIKLVSTLSGPLRAEVYYHTFQRPLRTHALFWSLCEEDSYTMREVSIYAITEQILAGKDLIFTRGTVGKVAYNILSGVMTYVSQVTETEEFVRSPAWISEQVLWTDWIHFGDFYSRTLSRCLALDADMFCEQIRKHQETFTIVQAYAKARVDDMSMFHAHDVSDILREDQSFVSRRQGDSRPVLQPRLKYRHWLMQWLRRDILGTQESQHSPKLVAKPT